jgi:hypothetical protein
MLKHRLNHKTVFITEFATTVERSELNGFIAGPLFEKETRAARKAVWRNALQDPSYLDISRGEVKGQSYGLLAYEMSNPEGASVFNERVWAGAHSVWHMTMIFDGSLAINLDEQKRLGDELMTVILKQEGLAKSAWWERAADQWSATGNASETVHSAQPAASNLVNAARGGKAVTLELTKQQCDAIPVKDEYRQKNPPYRYDVKYDRQTFQNECPAAVVTGALKFAQTAMGGAIEDALAKQLIDSGNHNCPFPERRPGENNVDYDGRMNHWNDCTTWYQFFPVISKDLIAGAQAAAGVAKNAADHPIITGLIVTAAVLMPRQTAEMALSYWSYQQFQKDPLFAMEMICDSIKGLACMNQKGKADAVCQCMGAFAGFAVSSLQGAASGLSALKAASAAKRAEGLETVIGDVVESGRAKVENPVTEFPGERNPAILTGGADPKTVGRSFADAFRKNGLDRAAARKLKPAERVAAAEDLFEDLPGKPKTTASQKEAIERIHNLCNDVGPGGLLTRQCMFTKGRECLANFTKQQCALMMDAGIMGKFPSEKKSVWQMLTDLLGGGSRDRSTAEASRSEPAPPPPPRRSRADAIGDRVAGQPQELTDSNWSERADVQAARTRYQETGQEVIAPRGSPDAQAALNTRFGGSNNEYMFSIDKVIDEGWFKKGKYPDYDSQWTTTPIYDSKSPVKEMYGDGATREVYWPKNKRLAADGTRTTDFGNSRIVVNSVGGKPVSLETMVRDPSDGKFKPFFYVREGDHWVQSRTFRGVPIENACISCHRDGMGSLSPMPTQGISQSGYPGQLQREFQDAFGSHR